MIVKCAKDKAGEAVFVSSEKAFSDQAKAEQYVRSTGKTVWEENVQGFHCTCERGIHALELE